MSRFIPRTTFAVPNSIPRTYYLGHHHAGVTDIKTRLASISLILECRDFRIPLSTQNPQLERAVAGRERIVVYTKTKLGSDTRSARDALKRFHRGSPADCAFWDKNTPGATDALLTRVKEIAAQRDSPMGLRLLVVGMPNVGKSTLINSLCAAGTPGRKANMARTGDQPGITRRVGMTIRMVKKEEEGSSLGGGVFVQDTPGVFQPYVHDGETMIKVALAQGIKKGLVPDEILADYLLYRMNQWDPTLYARYCEPTNDVNELLAAVASKEGKLKAGGVPNWTEAGKRIVTQWSKGELGRHVLDDLSREHLEAHERDLLQPALSMNQAKKMQKEERKNKRAGV